MLASTAEAIDCSDGIVSILMVAIEGFLPVEGVGLQSKVLPGLQLWNSYGPVPSGVLASVSGSDALVDRIERFTEVSPSRIDVSGRLKMNSTLYVQWP